MRVLAAALAVLLLVAICSLAQADLRDSGNAGFYKKALAEPIACCFSFISRPIPRRLIQSAYRTSSLCAKEAVILVTRKGREMCVDPKAIWLQEYLEDFELLDLQLFPTAAPGQ